MVAPIFLYKENGIKAKCLGLNTSRACSDNVPNIISSTLCELL